MKRSGYVLLASLLLVSCLGTEDRLEENAGNELIPITLSGEIAQATKANDYGFCDGDVIGVYIVDYNDEEPGTLVNVGNRADNVRFTFDEPNWKWHPARELFWKDKHTKIDVYGYYPYSSISDVNSIDFEVYKDQASQVSGSEMGGYEASDLLWAKAEGASPEDKIIRLQMKHILSSVRVNLVEGDGFSAGEWDSAEKNIIVSGTRRTGRFDISSGDVEANGAVPETGIIPVKFGEDFKAVVIPQTVDAGVPLILVTIDGQTYSFVKDEAMVFHKSKQHNFTITINKKASGNYEFVPGQESIVVWENDDVSHNATGREYIIVNVEEPGTLAATIESSGKRLDSVRSLKLTGKINAADFYDMRDRMSSLQSLNLKEVKIVGDRPEDEDVIPWDAMTNKMSLVRLILPDQLREIGSGAFRECMNLAGSLYIPEGVETIGDCAFFDCHSLKGTLSLPSTLKKIEGTAFRQCSFVCELILPMGLEYIGGDAFSFGNHFYGNLHLPESLKELGIRAFHEGGTFSGSLEIPQSLTVINQGIFSGCGFNGTLKLHNGISVIGDEAFRGCGFKGELVLPEELMVLGNGAFYSTDFSGTLTLPKKLALIGNDCFAFNWRLSGIVEIPFDVQSIGSYAFQNCRGIEGLIFPENLESIQAGAFDMCFGINKIQCLGEVPPLIMDGAFNGVAKDNFTVEVPDAAVVQYQTAVGWNDFKRISAYRQLVARPAMASAINTSVTREIVLNADNEWEVSSCPDWVTMSQMEGKGKTELNLTFQQMAPGSETREGDVVFRLKESSYTTRIHVSQYDYMYAEDQFITLNEASKGLGINIVFLGDGFDAKDIHEGKLIASLREAYENFFSIEPYKSYKDYFTVYAGVSVSPESGIGGINTIIHNRFNTTFKDGVALGGRYGDRDFAEILNYACGAETVSQDNLAQTLVVMIPNTRDYGGISYLWDDGTAIAYCPMSDYGYPFDFRGTVQHEAGGHGFGKLGDEYIYHNSFIDTCPCTDCGHVSEFNMAKACGWYDNLSLTGKMHEVPWAHFIFDEKYSLYVDIYEGGWMHNRGVFRSEYNSCMNNDIPYYNTISRESIVRRIMAYAGETYDFESFKAKDVMENLPVTAAGAPATKSENFGLTSFGAHPSHRNPVIIKGRPKLN